MSYAIQYTTGEKIGNGSPRIFTEGYRHLDQARRAAKGMLDDVESMSISKIELDEMVPGFPIAIHHQIEKLK